jgi:glycosyltransferase involved in cell wall biosynthesis
MVPGSQQTGSEVVTHAFARALRAAGHETLLVGYRRRGTDPQLHPDDVVVGDRPIETREAGAWAALWMARAVVGRIPYTFAKYTSRRYARVVQTLLQERRVDAAIVDHAAMAWSRPRGEGAPPWAYLAHNVEYRLHATEARREGGALAWANAREARLLEGVETALADSADQVWTLSEADAEALSALGAAGRTRTFDLLPIAVPDTVAPEVEVDVAIIGTWTWSANRAGLKWFLEEVCPHLPPSLVVEVAGAGAETLDASPPGVRICGQVPEVMPFLQRARVVAIPSVRGEGVQIKTLDAIASGRPVVATPIATRGIDELPPTVAVAEEPSEFAARLVEAATAPVDPAAAKVATTWIEARREVFERRVAEAVDELAAGP